MARADPLPSKTVCYTTSILERQQQRQLCLYLKDVQKYKNPKYKLSQQPSENGL